MSACFSVILTLLVLITVHTVMYINNYDCRLYILSLQLIIIDVLSVSHDFDVVVDNI